MCSKFMCKLFQMPVHGSGGFIKTADDIITTVIRQAIYVVHWYAEQKNKAKE